MASFSSYSKQTAISAADARAVSEASFFSFLWAWMARIVVFLVCAVPAFYVVALIALAPCFDDIPGPYCSAHGGVATIVAPLCGLLAGVTAGFFGVRALNRAIRASRAN